MLMTNLCSQPSTKLHQHYNKERDGYATGMKILMRLHIRFEKPKFLELIIYTEQNPTGHNISVCFNFDENEVCDSASIDKFLILI